MYDVSLDHYCSPAQSALEMPAKGLHIPNTRHTTEYKLAISELVNAQYIWLGINLNIL